ncbi:hypothetical protein IAT38_006810 [Cryptococcus sp. DSM 104549]
MISNTPSLFFILTLLAGQAAAQHRTVGRHRHPRAPRTQELDERLLPITATTTVVVPMTATRTVWVQPTGQVVLGDGNDGDGSDGSGSGQSSQAPASSSIWSSAEASGSAGAGKSASATVTSAESEGVPTASAYPSSEETSSASAGFTDSAVSSLAPSTYSDNITPSSTSASDPISSSAQPTDYATSSFTTDAASFSATSSGIFTDTASSLPSQSESSSLSTDSMTLSDSSSITASTVSSSSSFATASATASEESSSASTSASSAAVTETMTESASASATESASETESASATHSATGTASETESASETLSASETETESATATATESASETLSSVDSSATAPATVSETQSLSASKASPSSSSTHNSSATATESSWASESASETASLTASSTASLSASETLSETASETASATDSESLSASETSSFTESATLSVTSSLSATETATSTTSTTSPNSSTTATSTSSSASSTSTLSTLGDTLMLGYYPDWSATTLSPESVDWSRYDMLDFAFAVPASDGSLTWTQDDSADILNRLVSTGHAAGKRVKLSIGGWTGSAYFSDLVASSSSRSNFVSNIVEWYDKYDLDGIDIDWEYPGTSGADGNAVSSSDSANFLLFLQALRSALPSDAIITTATQVWPFADTDGNPMSDVSAFADVIDWILIMNYDVWGSSTTPGANAPLSDGCGNSTQPLANAYAAVASWTAAGMPAKQITLGVPAYGYLQESTATQLKDRRSLQTLPPHKRALEASRRASYVTVQNEDGGTSDGQVMWDHLVSQGALELSGSSYIGAGGFTRHWDSCSSTPWLKSTSSGQIITYDDPESMNLKGQFAAQSGLRGCNVFSIDGDYTDSSSWPLTDAVRSGLGL